MPIEPSNSSNKYFMAMFTFGVSLQLFNFVVMALPKDKFIFLRFFYFFYDTENSTEIIDIYITLHVKFRLLAFYPLTSDITDHITSIN